MLNVSVAITSFNRRSTTLTCLKMLYSQEGLNETWKLRTFLVDDGSSDGTGKAIKEAFPEVELISGTGSLFWGGGMNLAMSRAMSKPYDFLVMLNDDVTLNKDAVSCALSNYRTLPAEELSRAAILVGSCLDPSGCKVLYSGYARTSAWNPCALQRLLPINGAPRRVDTLNGNFVVVAREAGDILGPIDATFVHQLGDLDYGYRARAAGISVWLLGKPVGYCLPNFRTPEMSPERGLLARWRSLNHPLRLPFKSWVVFMWRHGGIAGLLILLYIYFKRIWRS